MEICTSLPNLPFINYGQAELRPNYDHSPATMAPRRKYPKTDLKTLTPWTSFPADIHRVIESAMTHAHLDSTPFTLQVSTVTRYVESEASICSHVMVALHDPVDDVLRKLGVNGLFSRPAGGAIPMVGDPNFAWITQRQPKVIIECKTWWSTDLQHVVDAFNGTRNDTLSRQSLYALEQIYGYMSFNNLKFGILTNWRCALFLRRAATSDRKTLEYYIIELDEPGQPISMLKACVGLLLLAEDDWFCAPPTISSAPPGVNARTPTAAWKERKKTVFGGYRCLTLDFHRCLFDISSASRGEDACVVNAQFPAPSAGKPNLPVVCKVVDVSRFPDTAELLENEARAYAALQNLQGKVIPTVYGFYQVWGILQLLALEPVGNAIPEAEDEQISQELRMKMKAVLQRIHDAGFVHGDIARRNFCRTEKGDVFLVDLERCKRSGDPSESSNEMNEVDRL